MSKSLVIVESPAKAKTIEKFLGRNYSVKASMGHLRDLPKSQFGIDIENEFTPKYINIRGKGDLIKSLRSAAKNAAKVFLASDPDREGEAISWHLAHLLGLDETQLCRIEFHEITKTAIQAAIKNPRCIDFAKVDAQQARRLLDRLVGYKLSPLLWRKVRKGLSAGRVQSVAVRLICDREKEILAFVPEEYWSIGVKLRDKPKGALFEAQLLNVDGKKAVVTNEADAEKIAADLEQAEYFVKEVKKRERRRNPAAPFITSSLQQEAARKLGFTSRRTMMVAQQLYEGLEIGSSGPIGLITYMRTDSVRSAESAIAEVREYISGRFGERYLPEKPNIYTSKKSQDAHEAIRPTQLDLPPEAVEKFVSKEQFKLYKLIWDRFLASQMTPAVYDTVSVDIEAERYGLRSTGSQMKFAGFMHVYSESRDDSEKEKDVLLPELEAGQKLPVFKVLPKQHFTEPPPRYSEATLVKVLEEKGIGRPSTYTPIVETIIARGYVIRAEKRFQPTELGFVVLDLLKEYFPDIVNAEFTAGLEGRLDEIAEGRDSRLKLLQDFYGPFGISLAYAEEAIGHVELPVEESDVICEFCGRNLVVKRGKFGNFLACPGFPSCRNTKAILKEIDVPCPKCAGVLVERKTKRGKVFYGCQKYPECDFMTWDMPLKEKCPVCNSFLLKHNLKNGRFVTHCSNEACSTRQNEKTNEKKPAKRTPVKAGEKGEEKLKTTKKTTKKATKKTTKKATAAAEGAKKKKSADSDAAEN